MAEHANDAVAGELPPPPPMLADILDFTVVLEDASYDVPKVKSSNYQNGFLVLIDHMDIVWSFNASQVVYFTMTPSDE